MPPSQTRLAIPRVALLADVSVHFLSSLEYQMARQVSEDINGMLLLFRLFFRLCGLRFNRDLDFLPRRKLWRAYLDGAVWANHRACMYHCSHRRFTLPFHRTMFHAQFQI